MEEELDSKELRTMAVKRLEGRPVQKGSAEENVKLVAELTIHQEELNIQNEELRRVQLELESTRAKYFELYNMAPVGYITLDDNLIIKEANLAASRLLGSDKSQIINKGVSSFIPSEQHESLYLHYRRLSSVRENPTHIFTIKRRDGSEVEIQFESNLGHDVRANGFRSILTDVTELRKAELCLKNANDQLEEKVLQRTKDLSESEAKYRSLFENSLDAVLLTKPDGSILSANPAASPHVPNDRG